MESTASASAEATSAAVSETRIVSAGMVADQRVQFVLEPSALDGAVDPAFLRRARLPPPAAGTARGAGLNRPGARSAADRGVALVVERVVRHVALADVIPDLAFSPLGER